MANKVDIDPQKLLKNKIRAFLKEQEATGLLKMRCNRKGYTACRVNFILFGFFGVFLNMLYGLIIYMALGSGLADAYRLTYRGFVFPTVLCFVACVGAVIFMLCKKERIAFGISFVGGFAQLLEVIQLVTQGYDPSYKPAMIVMYSLLFIIQLCAVVMLVLRKSDRKTEKLLFDKALRTIYASRGKNDDVMSGDELIVAIEEYTPKLSALQKK